MTDAPIISTASKDRDAPSQSLKPYLIGSVAVLSLLLGGLGGWAATAQLAGAVIAPGTVIVETNSKKVQHPTGGIIGEIRVREGSSVREGDLIARLDETVTRANLQVVLKQLDELSMRQVRLKAERDAAAEVTIPVGFAGRETDPLIADIIKGEQSLFLSRRAGRESQKSQLRERIAQTRQEIRGLGEQFNAKTKEDQLIKLELTDLEKLLQKNLVAAPRVNAIRRDAARIEGERGQMTAQIAQAHGRIAETEFQIVQIDQDLRTEIVRDLRETQAKEAELVERRIAAEDQLKRVEIRSPQDGVVHQLAVHTIGGVVSGGEPMMLIVPDGDKLMIEAKVQQQDIEQVRLGTKAYLRMTAFNQRTTPEIIGQIDRIAADLTREQQTGLSYFTVRVVITEDELAKLGGGRLLPGMPVDVQMKTEERTALSYLLRPFTDQVARAFKER
jgi:HlyD family secretion protein